MKKNIVHIIESCFPKRLVLGYRKAKNILCEKSSICRNNKNLKRIAGKEEIYNVLFFLENSAIWKHQFLYNLMLKSKSFNPIVVVCPNILKSHKDMISDMNRTCQELTNQGCHVLLAYDTQKNTYIDVRALNPHVIFFTNAWEIYVDERFRIGKYPDVLTCYMNYGWATTPYKWSFLTNVSMRAWRYFQECVDYNLILKEWTSGGNSVVTGSPMFDSFAHAKTIGKDWKLKDSSKKKVIYAPHHSIPVVADGLVSLSTFLIHCEVMLEIAEQYKDSIQFVFKPHPLLLRSLSSHPQWGREKADTYYQKWTAGENTAFVDGDYIDLFLTSDAMIHDCSSFTMEYLCTRKPVCFLSNDQFESQSNRVAIRAYNAHYKAKTKADICNFLEEVVLKNIDPKLIDREEFYNDVLLPPNGCTASENILNELKKSLKINEDII